MTHRFKSKHTSPSFYILCNMQCFSFALHVLIFTHCTCNIWYILVPCLNKFNDKREVIQVCLNFNLVQYMVYTCIFTLWLIGWCEIYLYEVWITVKVYVICFSSFSGIFWLVFKIHYNLLVYCDLWHKCQFLCHFKFSENARKIVLSFTYFIEEFYLGPS